jgi:DNA polymerase III gamma/tau subunit
MAKYMVTENEVKKALAIDSFRNMSKDKIMEFVSAIPNMDKDVAIKIIEQFPAYTESANNMLAQLNTMCNNAMKENGESQKEAIKAYKKILDDLGELLKKDTITAEERAQITEQMITVADRISAKDTENKDFLNGIIKYGVPIIGGALVLGAAILGVNIKGTKIPTLK